MSLRLEKDSTNLKLPVLQNTIKCNSCITLEIVVCHFWLT